MRGVGFVYVLVSLLGAIATTSFASTVTYDHRALVIDGKRRVLISGSIHYPRSTPDMWPDLIQKSKDGGLDVIETYVFWNLHEPVRRQYDFKGRNDLVKFVKTVAEAGLYVHLRIGPYVCAEWNYGGFPLWLHFIPGIQFRTDNGPFKVSVSGGDADIHGKDCGYDEEGKSLCITGWTHNLVSASMATSLDTGVPWVMCQQADAPDPMINTCNGFYCDQFTPNSVKKPKMWTENWTGWFLSFGGAVPYRPVEDIAFAVARFFQLECLPMMKFSTFSVYIAGLLRQPKWGHLKDLHKAIKLCEAALIATDPTITSLGTNLEASVYKTGTGSCAAFLANVRTNSDATVNFSGNSYHLPAWSVSILPDCKNVALNTAQINSMAVMPRFMQQSLKNDIDSSDGFQSGWSWVDEPVGISKNNAFTKLGLLEQINITADKSDYLWYSLSTEIQGDEPFLEDGSQTVLLVESLGHALHAFINGKLAG
ncbi:Beta-galactosidase 8 [Vitis vinifera]|uniref:beta-galactosidase n=1 Tax=Vitis vinifera TaxID=29760 RepID=A0A438IKI6_VITVI|nr:Beta-galactosidase 8 [Vitis vinifera]